jgi:hypothetical protein
MAKDLKRLKNPKIEATLDIVYATSFPHYELMYNK